METQNIILNIFKQKGFGCFELVLKSMVGIFHNLLTFNDLFMYNVNRFFEKECGNSSVVEHDLAKVGAAGSIPVSRSIT